MNRLKYIFNVQNRISEQTTSLIVKAMRVIPQVPSVTIRMLSQICVLVLNIGMNVDLNKAFMQIGKIFIHY
jgi:hypothetical protein